MMALSRKLLETVRTTGLVDLRGRKPGAPKPASVVAAEKKAEANAQRVTAKYAPKHLPEFQLKMQLVFSQLLWACQASWDS